MYVELRCRGGATEPWSLSPPIPDLTVVVFGSGRFSFRLVISRLQLSISLFIEGFPGVCGKSAVVPIVIAARRLIFR